MSPSGGSPAVGASATAARAERLRSAVRDVPDFPCPGVRFRDVTPLLADAGALAAAVDALAADARPLHPDLVLGAEARGFIFGTALARELGAGFVPARRPGKLPGATVAVDYELEYGAGELEVHVDAIASGSRVLVHDDLLATGGTAGALCALAQHLGGELVGCSFLIELYALGGRERLAPHAVHSVLCYEN